MDAVAEVRMPWFDTSRRNKFSRFFATIGWSLTQPGKLMSSIPEGLGVGSGLVFLASIQLVSLSFVFFPMMLVVGLPRLMGGPGPGVYELFNYIMFPVGLYLMVLIHGLLAHLVLACTGNIKSGLSRTILASTFSGGPFILCAVPCVGMCIFPVSFVWWLVAMIIMVQVGQAVSGLRATIAGLVTPLLGVMIWGGIIVLGVYSSSNRTAGMMNPPAAQIAVQNSGVEQGIDFIVTKYSESNGSLIGPEEFKSTYPELTGAGGNEKSFVTDGVKGWWLGNMFVIAMEGTDLVILRYGWDGTLLKYWKNKSAFRTMGSSGRDLLVMIEDFQVVREEAGYPRIPEAILQEWLDTQEP